jgi:transposase
VEAEVEGFEQFVEVRERALQRTAWLLYGARYSPHDNPVERVWAGMKNYVANTAVTWPGRLRQPAPPVPRC